jgi:hypothetical protein
MSETKRKTSADMIRDTRELATRAFERHVITRRTDRSWVLQRIHEDGRPESTYATEVIALELRGLYVGGDIAPVIFGGGGRHPVGTVYWMGECNDLGHYVREKASIGLGGAQMVDRWERELAGDDLRSWIEERREEADDESAIVDDEHALHLAFNADNEREFFDHACEALGGGDAWEAVSGMGVTLDARVIYAHAALARLSVLLREEERQKAADALLTHELTHHG